MESLVEPSGIADVQSALLIGGPWQRSPARSRSGAPAAIGPWRCDVGPDDGVDDLVAVLTAAYPVVRQLLWDDTFERVARAYAAFMLTQSPTLLAFGTGFPPFLRGVGDGAAADYLADVAALESAYARARSAPAATPLDPGVLTTALTNGVADLRLALHPSMTLLASRFPVVDIWEAVRREAFAVPRWRPQWALIARPGSSVEVSDLSENAYKLLLALSEGWSLRCAAARAAECARGFELDAAVTDVVRARVVTGVVADGVCPPFQPKRLKNLK